MAVFVQNAALKRGLEEEAVASLLGRSAERGAELLDAYVETGEGFDYRLALREQSHTGERRILTSLWRAGDDFTGVPASAYADEVTFRRVELVVAPVPTVEFCPTVGTADGRTNGG